MTARRTFYCDWEDCNAFGPDEMRGWIVVKEPDVPAKHFCNGDCLFKWAAAHSEPPTVIPFEGEL